MNDNELDILFKQSVQRQKAVEQINKQVMKTVRRDMRIKVLRKWTRLVGLSFGIPALIVLYIYLLYTFMPAMPLLVQIAAYAMPLSIMGMVFGKSLHDFSPSEL